MHDPIQELKIRAELLHRQAQREHPAALARLRKLRQINARAAPAAALDSRRIQRRECLAALARELGFSGWLHARAVLSGDPRVEDFGTLLYPRRCGGFLNSWYHTYAQAVAGQQAAGGYLLAYRRDFFVADRLFVESIGLGQSSGEWQKMNYDWVRPANPEARRQLYGRLIEQLPREVAP